MQRKKFFNIKTIVVIGFLLVIFFSGIILSGFIGNSFPFFGNNAKTEARTIQESIQTIAELSTLSYNYRDVGLFSDQKTMKMFGNEFGILGTSKSFIICYDGEVKLGLDASLISVDIKDNNILIALPPIQILSHSIKEDSVQLLDEKSGLFNKISVTDYTNFITEAKQKIDEKLYENNLFLQAQVNAEEQIKALLLALPNISEEYEVSFIK